MCFDRLKRRFQHKKLRKDIETKILADYKGKAIRTGHGGPTMPKYQPCPKCRGGSERDNKTEDGAFYNCVKHGVFFVRKPRRKPHIPVAQHSK